MLRFGNQNPQLFISGAIDMLTYDLAANGLRGLNEALQAQSADTNQAHWDVINPKGSHAIAVGLNAPIDVTVHGSTGYYCGGMNKQASIRVKGQP